MLIDIDQIKIKNRVRKDLSDLDNLKDSLKRYGLLNPITVTADYNLIAGHRRLEAAKQLGWTTINAIVVPVDDEVTKLEMELEENTQRKDFTDAELLEGYKRLEKLRNPSFFQKLWRKIKDFFSKLFIFLKKEHRMPLPGCCGGRHHARGPAADYDHSAHVPSLFRYSSSSALSVRCARRRTAPLAASTPESVNRESSSIRSISSCMDT